MATCCSHQEKEEEEAEEAAAWSDARGNAEQLLESSLRYEGFHKSKSSISNKIFHDKPSNNGTPTNGNLKKNGW